MSEKHILLADPDAKAAEEFRQALGAGWIVKATDSSSAALQELKTGNYQAIVASLRLTDLPPGQLLNRVRGKYPQVVRFIVAAERDRQRVVKEALGAHQFLIRPFDPQTLRTTIDSAFTSDHWVESETMRKLVGRMRTLPTIPALYLEIAAALKSPDSTTEEVGALIAEDMAITTKLLQVINSAFFGLPRTVTSPAEAIGLLGFETAKSMVMAVKLLNQYDRIKTGTFSIDGLWHHCTAVAQSARQLVMLHTGERDLADEAFAAGLLHDVGKAVLAGNFGEQYAGAASLARKQHLEMCAVEKEIFGAHHGEVGAYLLSLWGLPRSVLEATALHHEPARSSGESFSILTAIHVANALHYVAHPISDGQIAPQLNRDYLARMATLEYLPAWCDELLGPETAARFLTPEQAQPVIAPPDSGESRPEVSAPAQPVDPVPVPESDELSTQSEANPAAADLGPSPAAIECPDESFEISLEAASAQDNPGRSKPSWSNKWFVGAAVGAVCLVAVWFILPQFRQSPPGPVNVRARPAKQLPIAEPAQSADPQATRASAGIEMDDQVESNTNTVATVQVSTEPTNAPVLVPAVTNDLAQTLPAKRLDTFPALKLQGILSSPGHPVAIINGTLVHPNDTLEGARVLEISGTSVTLEYHHQRKRLDLD